jgi:hypothetical protein
VHFPEASLINKAESVPLTIINTFCLSIINKDKERKARVENQSRNGN